jgi:hypothetical protein
LVLIVNDHYDLKAVAKDIKTINEEGGRKLREHLRDEERYNMQQVYMQADITDVKTKVGVQSEKIQQINVNVSKILEKLEAIERRDNP